MIWASEQGFPCSPWRRWWQSRCFTAACGDYHVGADIHTSAHEGTRAGAGRRALKEAAACGESAQEKAYPGGLQPVGNTRAGAGEKCEEKGAAERSPYGLTTSPKPRLSRSTRFFILFLSPYPFEKRE